jgi:putative DNA primase/helicase
MEAIASRWAVVGFNKTYSMKPDLLKGELQADPRFKDDPNFLKEKVAPAFLNLLIKQLEDIAINGIDYNPLQENLEKIKRDSSHLFQFCNDVGIEEDSNGKIYINDLWELLRNWYMDQGILELEISDKGKEKLIFHDSANKYDRHVKSNNQIRARFTEIFPKLKWGKNMVRGENYNRAYLGGIVQTALTDLTPTDTIDTALTDDLTVKGSVKAVSITESHVKSVKAINTTSLSQKEKINLFKNLAFELFPEQFPYPVAEIISDLYLAELQISIPEAKAQLKQRYGTITRKKLGNDQMLDHLEFLSAIETNSKP